MNLLYQSMRRFWSKNGIFNQQVEFDTPVGYQEPKRIPRKSEAETDAEANEQIQNDYMETNTFVAFSGEGSRLDGKKKKCDKPEPSSSVQRVNDVNYIHVFLRLSIHWDHHYIDDCQNQWAYFHMKFVDGFFSSRRTFVAFPTMIIHMDLFASIDLLNQSVNELNPNRTVTMMILSRPSRELDFHCEKVEND